MLQSSFPLSHPILSKHTHRARILHKSIVFLTVISMLLPFVVGCDKANNLSGSESKNYYSITYSVIDEGQYQMHISKNGQTNAVNPDDYYWEVNDTRIASITASGILTAMEGGYVVVRAFPTSSEGMVLETELFLPYSTVEAGKPKVTQSSDNVDDVLLKLGAAFTKKVSDSLLSFLFTDNEGDYLCSAVHNCYDVTNGELYVVCDWTNSDVFVTYSNPDQSKVQSAMCDPYASNIQMDDSINSEVIPYLASVMDRELSHDHAYYFSQMDSQYEYRVVVRGDYEYSVTEDYYIKGLVSGLYNTIKNIIKGKDWENLKENYTTSRVVGKINNVENVRVCIERRPK